MGDTRLLVIKTGRTYDSIQAQFGCFEDWIARGLGVDAARIKVVSVVAGEPLPDTLDGIAGIVITGSPAMVSDRESWSEDTARWLHERLAAAPLPTLGICYGHQLLAHAFGGEVDYNPRGREIGTIELRRHDVAAGDPLFGDLPQQWRAHVTHRQSALRLPDAAVLLASSAQEPHHAFRLGEAPVWGVQFHPEFCEGIMRAYIEVLGEAIRREGTCTDNLLAQVAPCPESGSLLRRFARIAGVIE
jgi:GMP synthase (glutamine-hydrolysing)